jgi:hypothetical protein
MIVDWWNADAPPASCRTTTLVRACARRIATFTLAPSAELSERAARVAERHGPGSGRVQGAGTLTDRFTLSALRAALPSELSTALRPSFEWYSCRGAHFHNDAHYGDVLFGAWCVAGTATDIVFPRIALHFACRVGTAILFDPFEPHGVLLPGQRTYAAKDYAGIQPSVFLAFEIALTDAVRTAFEIGAPTFGALEFSSERAVNAETGALS